MAGRIPREFIDELMRRADIVDVIEPRIDNLKKAGREYKACCPFHTEKTPSFTVSPDKQFYHCFGCGAHGTAVSFLMEFERLSFVEAIEELAAQFGLEVPREAGGAPGPAPVSPDEYQLLEAAAAHYRKALREHPARAEAIDYLKARGLSGEIAARFGIGLAPPGWDNLREALGTDPARSEALVRLGLLVRNEQGRLYDRFRHRVMFPIRDRRGRVIAFGGRVLDDGTPKYLNSPESAVFHKGRELYGLYEALQPRRRPDRLLVVEGYMDVVALAQKGIDYAVATLGTATSREHLEAVFRAASEVVFCFDGDRAGRQAAWRALENVLPTLRDGRQARFLFLPEGEDPDSLVRSEGRAAFEARIQGADTLSEYLFEHLQEQADTRTLDGRARLVELARPLIGRLPNGAYRDAMANRAADIGGISIEQMSQLLAGSGEAAVPRSPARPRVPDGDRSLVRAAIGTLLRRPQLAGRAQKPEKWRVLPMLGVKLLVDMLELLKDCPQMSTGALVEHWRDSKYGEALARLASREPLLSPQAEEREFLAALERLDQLVLEHGEVAADKTFSPADLTAEQREAKRKQYRLRLLAQKERARSLSAEEALELGELREGRTRAD